ncbi:hypothetical protein J437_LFUL015146, partial [Ladona fulva]
MPSASLVPKWASGNLTEKHPGCKDGCSRHGSCAVEDGEYKCVCAEGWAGADCSIRLELECADETDNDG